MVEQIGDMEVLTRTAQNLSRLETTVDDLGELIRQLLDETDVASKYSPEILAQRVELAISALHGGFDVAPMHLTEEFETLFKGEHCSVDIRAGSIGAYEVRCSQTGNYDSAFQEMYNELKGARNYPKDVKNGWCIFDPEPTNTIAITPKSPITVTFTPVITTSIGAPTASFARILETHDLTLVPFNFLVMATQAFRIKYGFPESSFDIGSREDRGDLLQGFLIPTTWGNACSSRAGVQKDYNNLARDHLSKPLALGGMKKDQ